MPQSKPSTAAQADRRSIANETLTTAAYHLIALQAVFHLMAQGRSRLTKRRGRNHRLHFGGFLRDSGHINRSDFAEDQICRGWTTRPHNGNVLTCRGATDRRTFGEIRICVGWIDTCDLRRWLRCTLREISDQDLGKRRRIHLTRVGVLTAASNRVCVAHVQDLRSDNIGPRGEWSPVSR